MTKKKNQKSLARRNESSNISTGLKFKVGKTKNQYGKSDIRAFPDVQEGKEEEYFNTVSEITGTMNEMLGQQLIQQAVEASPQAKKIDVKAEAVSAALSEMQPKDAIEGMLVTQLIALHNQMMDYMRKSIEVDWQVQESISRYLKINRQFLACLHGLQRYRNRGQQNVVFQNVNVGSDSQAIVGCVQPPN